MKYSTNPVEKIAQLEKQVCCLKKQICTTATYLTEADAPIVEVGVGNEYTVTVTLGGIAIYTRVFVAGETIANILIDLNDDFATFIAVFTVVTDKLQMVVTGNNSACDLTITGIEALA